MKILQTMISILSSCLLGLVFVLMDAVSYGRQIFPTANFEESEKIVLQNVSMIIFLTSTFISQIVFGLSSKIKSGILASFIVEAIGLYSKIFEDIYDRVDSSDSHRISKTITNTLFCTSISTLLFSGISYFSCLFDIGKYLAYIPKSALMGCFGGIGIAQFKVAMNEIGIVNIKNVIDTTILGLLVTIIIVSFIGFFLQDKYPNFIILIPLYTIVLVGVFYGASKISGFGIDDLRTNKWLPIEEKGSLNIKMISEHIKIKYLNMDHILPNIPSILSLAAFNLIHLPVNLATYALETGLKAKFEGELKAQALGNLFSALVGAPTYFVCSNSIFFRRSGGLTKMSSLVLGLAILALFKIGLYVKSYTPVFILAFFPFFIGVCICYSAFYNTYGKLKDMKNRKEYIILLISALISWKIDAVYGLIFGLLLNLLSFIKDYLSSLDSAKNLEYEKIVEDSINVNYILFFGSIQRLMTNIDDKLNNNRNKKIIIDLRNCYSIDWLARDTLLDKIDENKNEWIIIGKPKYFHIDDRENLKLFQSFEEYHSSKVK